MIRIKAICRLRRPRGRGRIPEARGCAVAGAMLAKCFESWRIMTAPFAAIPLFISLLLGTGHREGPEARFATSSPSTCRLDPRRPPDRALDAEPAPVADEKRVAFEDAQSGDHFLRQDHARRVADLRVGSQSSLAPLLLIADRPLLWTNRARDTNSCCPGLKFATSGNTRHREAPMGAEQSRLIDRAPGSLWPRSA